MSSALGLAVPARRNTERPGRRLISMGRRALTFAQHRHITERELPGRIGGAGAPRGRGEAGEEALLSPPTCRGDRSREQYAGMPREPVARPAGAKIEPLGGDIADDRGNAAIGLQSVHVEPGY